MYHLFKGLHTKNCFGNVVIEKICDVINTCLFLLFFSPGSVRLSSGEYIRDR